MMTFDTTVGGRWFRSIPQLGRLVAVLFLSLASSVTIHAQNASPVSASPSSGGGTFQTFTLTYTDTAKGGGDLQNANFYVMNSGVTPGVTSGWSAHECVVLYNVPSNVIQLAQDAGGAFLPNTATAGTPQIVSNSQCTVIGSSSSATVSGSTVTVTLLVGFTAAFGVTQGTTKDLHVSRRCGRKLHQSHTEGKLHGWL